MQKKQKPSVYNRILRTPKEQCNCSCKAMGTGARDSAGVGTSHPARAGGERRGTAVEEEWRPREGALFHFRARSRCLLPLLRLHCTV
jgi:hypothetical protein